MTHNDIVRNAQAGKDQEIDKLGLQDGNNKESLQTRQQEAD